MWERIVRTGDVHQDGLMVADYRRFAASQGLGLQVVPLPLGGFQVVAVPPVAAAQAGPVAGPRPAPARLPTGGTCQVCRRAAPLKQVTLRQNIGLLVMRLTRSIRGELCKPCIETYFWRMTLVTFFLGPWGVISSVVWCFIVPSNLVQYLSARGLPDGDALGPVHLRPRQMRGMVLAIAGLLGVGVALLFAAAGVAMAVAPEPGDGSTPGIVVMLFSLLVLGVPCALVTAAGGRSWRRATRALAAIGA